MGNILIADDTCVIRKILRSIMTEMGHNIVAEVDNGKRAINAYKEHMPDLVTMDIDMPVMNGLNACKMITDEFPDAKIVMLSSMNNRGFVLQAFRNGAKHYLTKPFEKEKVIEVIKELLPTPIAVQIDNCKSIEHDENFDHKNIEQEEPKAFTTDEVDGIIQLKVDLEKATSNVGAFYASVLGFLRKYLFSKIKHIHIEFTQNGVNDSLIQTLTEILNLVLDAGFTVEIDSGAELKNSIEKYLISDKIIYLDNLFKGNAD